MGDFWTNHEMRVAREGWDAGKTLDMIADELCRSPLSVRGAVVRAGFPKRPKPQKQAYVWTPDRAMRLKRLRRLGQSWDEIGEALGVTAEAAETQHRRIKQ